MAAPALKDIYKESFFENLLDVWKKLEPNISPSEFKRAVFNSEWENKALKSRINHIATCLKEQLPDDFNRACHTLLEIISQLNEQGHAVGSYEYLFFPEYIELYGQDHYEDSLDAIYAMTKYISCEFTIRPFIIKQPEKTMNRMLLWSEDKHPNVRRLSSEGCRPRLPWSPALPELKKNPDPVLRILEKLKSDSSLFVKKSVANNLNDISKDHPELVLMIISKWQGKNANTNWVIKHACRSLLKSGDKKALELFGFKSISNFEISELKLDTINISLGEAIQFSSKLLNKSEKNQQIRIEYAIHYVKANGSLSKKVFKISERIIGPNSKLNISKSHVLKEMTTRKYYAGTHKIALIINGVEQERQSFNLSLPENYKR